MTELAWLSDYIIALAVIGTGIFLRAYLKKKAENLATKDDIGEITAKIEEVKHDYASRLESLRSTFQAKLQIDHVRYQNEYVILSDLSEKLVNLRDAAMGLRPVSDSYDPNEPEADRKKRRMEVFNDAVRQYYLVAAIKKPFIPEEMFEVVDELRRKCWSEAVRYVHRDPEKDPEKYWDDAEANAESIQELANDVIAAIRERVKWWELRETT